MLTRSDFSAASAVLSSTPVLVHADRTSEASVAPGKTCISFLAIILSRYPTREQYLSAVAHEQNPMPCPLAHLSIERSHRFAKGTSPIPRFQNLRPTSRPIRFRYDYLRLLRVSLIASRFRGGHLLQHT